MNEFLIIYDLPIEFDESFMMLIPQHRLRINQLLDEGVIKSYSLSADRSKLWMVIDVEEENDIKELLDSLPLQHKMLNYEIVPLMFNQVSAPGLPTLSLN